MHRSEQELPVPRIHRHQLFGGSRRLYLHTGGTLTMRADFITPEFDVHYIKVYMWGEKMNGIKFVLN